MSLRVISANDGGFLWLMSKIHNLSPLSSIAKASAAFQALTGSFRLRHEFVNSLNAGSVESKPILLRFSLVSSVETKKKRINNQEPS